MSTEEFERERAALEAIRAKNAYVRAMDAKDEEQQRQEARADVLRRWCAAGLESYVLPSSAAEFESLPLLAQLQLEQTDPSLARLLSPAQPLPAGVELRLSRGIEHLTPEDVPHLLRAGHADTVEQLRQRHQQQMLDAFEQSHQAFLEAAEQERAAAEERRLASERAFNEMQRQRYLEKIATTGRG